MPKTPELLIADLHDELAELTRLERSFATVEPMLAEPPEAVGDYDRCAIGYLLHNFYNGCGNVFRAIAAYFENDIGNDSRHADLLRRMRLDIPGHRPAVIDDELYRLLDDFRGFRHVFRMPTPSGWTGSASGSWLADCIGRPCCCTSSWAPFWSGSRGWSRTPEAG